ncbi:hypothetical protein AAVH_18322 [Aphelenchoides avenae]|nr:hypothetical protein AAVH_18322 [Aphelenchus avenae]
MELDFSKTWFTREFGLRIIELLKNCGRELTFRMRTCDDELVLDEREFTIGFDGTTTRYASDESGIVVEVKGRLISIQSTADVPRKKARNE